METNPARAMCWLLRNEVMLSLGALKHCWNCLLILLSQEQGSSCLQKTWVIAVTMMPESPRHHKKTKGLIMKSRKMFLPKEGQ